MLNVIAQFSVGVVPPALLPTFKTAMLFKQFHAGLLRVNAGVRS
jgi:hypothetical protein